MKYSNEYYNLIEMIPVLIDRYSEDTINSLGSSLRYKERVAFDYKVECERTGDSFKDIFAVYVHEKDFIKKLVENDELDYIVSHFEEIVTNDSKFTDTLFGYLSKNKDRISKEDMNMINLTIARCLSHFYPHVDDDDIETLKNLLVEAAKVENASLLDIRRIDYGGYSKIYKINDLIVKSGFKRICHEVVDNSRLLVPYFKGAIGSDFIEITDYVPCGKDANDDEVYAIYKELRDQGVIWIDPTCNNLARLTKRAADHINSCNDDKASLGIMHNPNKKRIPLKEGDLIIIDLDHIFFDYEDDKIKKATDELNDMLVYKNERYAKQYAEGKEKEKVKKIGSI